MTLKREKNSWRRNIPWYQHLIQISLVPRLSSEICCNQIPLLQSGMLFCKAQRGWGSSTTNPNTVSSSQPSALAATPRSVKVAHALKCRFCPCSGSGSTLAIEENCLWLRISWWQRKRVNANPVPFFLTCLHFCFSHQNTRSLTTAHNSLYFK